MPTLLPEPALIPRSPETRAAVADQLTPLLQCISELRFAVRTAHWNLRSPSFMQIHELFDEIETALGVQLDEIGERLKLLGAMPTLSIRAMGANPMHPELPATTNQDELIGTIVEWLTVYDSCVVYAARVAEAKIDLATMDLLIKHSGAIGHWLYVLGQHLSIDVLNQVTVAAQQAIKSMPRVDKAKPTPTQESTQAEPTQS